jgi:hypothetical protein
MEPEQRLPSNAGRVFDVLGFVKNHVLPVHALEILLILGDQLVAGDQNVKRSILIVGEVFLAPELAQRRTILHVAPIGQRFQTRNEAGDFLLPVM